VAACDVGDLDSIPAKENLLLVLKGQCHEIFVFWFFHESVSPSPKLYRKGRFKFFRKFMEIFAAQGLPPVSMTPVAYGKNLQSEKFL
jgi:hypothetical protein